MCREANCQHVKYNPNKPTTLALKDQASLWGDIKATREELEARTVFLRELGRPEHLDPQMIKLEALTKSLWARFRVL
jgi:hypothetical protein